MQSILVLQSVETDTLLALKHVMTETLDATQLVLDLKMDGLVSIRYGSQKQFVHQLAGMARRNQEKNAMIGIFNLMTDATQPAILNQAGNATKLHQPFALKFVEMVW